VSPAGPVFVGVGVDFGVGEVAGVANSFQVNLLSFDFTHLYVFPFCTFDSPSFGHLVPAKEAVLVGGFGVVTDVFGADGVLTAVGSTSGATSSLTSSGYNCCSK
jgi:hypothetical protein